MSWRATERGWCISPCRWCWANIHWGRWSRAKCLTSTPNNCRWSKWPGSSVSHRHRPGRRLAWNILSSGPPWKCMPTCWRPWARRSSRRAITRSWPKKDEGRNARRKRNEARARLLKQVMSAREEEQRRIARDLHDGIGQSLTSLLLGLRVAAEVPTFEEARVRLVELRGITASLLDEVRRLARGLRPTVLDDLGLAAVLERYAADYTEAHGIAVDVYAPDLALARLPAEVETALYRIAQETLTNVLKHAAATAVSLVVRRESSGVHLTVEDDGRGFRQRYPAPGAWSRRRSGPARHPRTGRPLERLRHARVAAGKRNYGPRVHSHHGGEPWRRFAC